jgi:hypothetical protein
MVRYSFPVRLFHSLLHAGLSRRSGCPMGQETIHFALAPTYWTFFCGHIQSPSNGIYGKSALQAHPGILVAVNGGRCRI